MRFTLWQRIFVYTIGLLLFSQALAFFLHSALMFDDMRRYFANTTRAVVAELEGQPLEMVLLHARIYSHGQQRIRLTNADGSALPGQDFSMDTVMRTRVKSRELEGLTAVELAGDPRFLIVAPSGCGKGRTCSTCRSARRRSRSARVS